jgi:hypothetical protein
MIRLDADTRQLQRLAQQLYGTAKRSKDERYTLALNVARALRDIAIERVEHTKTSPDGTPWAAWSEAYAATRGPDQSLLVDTRELVDSFEAYATPAGQKAVIENRAPHAGFVQMRREFLGVGQLEQNAAEQVALEWLDRLVPL